MEWNTSKILEALNLIEQGKSDEAQIQLEKVANFELRKKDYNAKVLYNKNTHEYFAIERVERNKGYRLDHDSRWMWEFYGELIKSGKYDKAKKFKTENLRNHYGRSCYGLQWENVTPVDEYEGRLLKVKIDYTMDEADWEEFREEEELKWYNPWDDGRDCTGVEFTSWMSLFRLKDGTCWVYHKTALDI